MSEATRYLRLPLSFDPARLAADLHTALSAHWPAHPNSQAYRGNWSSIALRSASGRSDDIIAYEGYAFCDTPLLDACGYFREVVNSFACETKAVRLMGLEAGAHILAHRDHGGSFEDGLARLHIPVQTDPSVMFTLDGEDVHFAAGHTWYMNANCMHAVRNPSLVHRVHLVLDCVPNDWLRGLFEQAGWVPNQPSKYGDPNITDANVHDVIAALRASGTPAGAELADRLAAQCVA